MEPETGSPEGPPTVPQASSRSQSVHGPGHAPVPFYAKDALSGFDALLIGPDGLRAGWTIVLFAMLYRVLSLVLSAIALGFDPGLARYDFSPGTMLMSELVPFAAMLLAAALVGLFEHRPIADYNLTGPRRRVNFLSGAVAGFLALSLLVGALSLGGWLRFGAVALSGVSILKFGALWGCVFLVVGGFEEGTFRCFLQFTLTRSINFWWALAIVGVLSADLLLRSRGQVGLVAFFWLTPLSPVTGNGLWGVYAAAALGFVPCLMLHLRKAEGGGFWQAAWVTSTLFGFIHMGNNGENWIGIFAAAAIGFVFCVSVWVTGSAWWAIGCHAAWDWAETYFYGTADSGFQAQGHYLASSPAGNILWSGGTDGPEGSLLVLGAISLLLVGLVVVYGRKRARVGE